MLYHKLLLAASLSLCASTLAAQSLICPVGQPIEAGETAVLALAGGASQADHLLVDMNSSGHAYVVWQSRIATGIYQAQGALLEWVPGMSYWLPHPTDLLGDPTHDLWGAGADTCIKPNVVAVGDNFVVAWQRVDDSDTTGRRYYLETVMIVPPTSSNHCHQVVRPSAGRGFLFADSTGTPWSFDAGVSGETVGLDRKRWDPTNPTIPLTNVAVAVGIHQVNPGSGALNDYELHGFFVTYPVTGNPSFDYLDGTATASHALIENIYVDEVGSYSGGGRVPPFVRETKAGGLIVSHDTMRSSTRLGGGSDEGRVTIHSLVFQSANTLNCVDTYEFQGPNADFYQRRTNIGTDYDTQDEIYSIAWLELDQDGNDGGGNLGAFRLDSSAMFLNPIRHTVYVDPSDEIADPRALFDTTYTSTDIDFLIGVNLQPPPAQADFEVYAWDRVNNTYDYEFVPKPTDPSVDVHDPRRPGMAICDGMPIPIVYDAEINTLTGERPFIYHKVP